jgi:hypothetical protein
MISGIAHINLPIPQGTLEQAEEFYGTTLGLTSSPVPELQKGTILWYVFESQYLIVFNVSSLQGSISALADSKCTFRLVQLILSLTDTRASNFPLVKSWKKSRPAYIITMCEVGLQPQWLLISLAR